MLSDSFRTIFHVEIYALIGFIIFFTFFILVSVNAFRMKKEEVDELSNLPLDDQEARGVFSDQSQQAGNQ
jgi:cbb3-type cytochrome oxidase subunit 3